MDIVRLATVVSTSTHAAGLLAAGKRPPFAVWATEQTAGRGRRGSVWASPPGNFYATLALPAPTSPAAEQGCLPLKAGIIVARQIEALVGLRITLKWPNDLLFGGRKLGGLLMEGSTTGQRAGDLLVGIGLNLASAPALSGPYRAVSVAEILGRKVDVEELGAALLAGFAALWDGLPLAEVPAAFASYATGEGQIWRFGEDAASVGTGAGAPARPGALAYAGHIGADGTLPLTPLAGGERLQLTSVDHGWRWLYQGDESAAQSAPLLVADVGNSALKLARFAHARDLDPRQVESVARGDAVGLTAALRRLAADLPARGWPLHVLSVCPPFADELAGAAAAVALCPLPLPKRPVRRHGDGYRLADLGADRLAAIEGWLAALPPAARGERTAFGIVVAAGTATTVDAVTTAGVHLGGLILPGLGTALASLHRATSLLPQVDLKDGDDWGDGLGHDTRSAIGNAVIEMTIGAIQRVRAWGEERGFKADGTGVVVTGGWGRLLAGAMGVRFEESLVVQGARVMVLGGWIDERHLKDF